MNNSKCFADSRYNIFKSFNKRNDMIYISMIAITVLIFISSLHLYWVFGGSFALNKVLPTKDGKRLINPGKILTTLVALVLMGFAYVLYTLYFEISYSRYFIYAGWSISAIFLLRAIGEFHIVGFFKTIKGTQFSHYDTKYFSPLCLTLAIFFGYLSYQA